MKQLACLVVVSVLLSGVAHAAGNVGVIEFTGAKKKALREKVIQALSNADVTVVEATGTAADDAPAYARIARENEVDAVVTGDTTMSKKGWTLTLQVRNGSDGEVVDEVVLKAGWFPGLLKKVDKEVASALSEPLEAAEGPSDESGVKDVELEEEPEKKASPDDDEPEEEPDDEDEADDDDPAPSGDKPPPFQLGLGLRAFSRKFRYNQDVNGNLRAYDLGAAPAAFIGATWYPVAHFSRGVPANIGITGDFEQSVGASSELTSGAEDSFATTMRAFSVGAHFRIPFGKHELGFSAKYGRHSFEVEGDENEGATNAQGIPVDRDFVPDVSYQYLRPGMDLRLRFGKVNLGAYAGYRMVLSTGDLEASQWFPELSATAVDMGLYGGYGVAKGLAVLGGVDLRRYGFDMHSRPEDLDAGRDVAGGAVDQYVAGWLGAEWRPGAD